ncbi:MAG TPA: dihydroneopterin aldolase [Mizugakiibacter sp.]|nr:dihydroneopterin aldolase [Mizugakiibacter sp.]
MDRIFLERLHVDTRIGVYAHEHEALRPLLLDLELAWDTHRAGMSDRLADTLDYAAIANRLRELGAACEVQLLETFAARCVEMLQREFGITWLHLTVRKPAAVDQCAAVGVSIERGWEPL